MGYAVARCPECKAQIKVDTSQRAVICPACGKPIVVGDAIGLCDLEFGGKGQVVRFGKLDWIVLNVSADGKKVLLLSKTAVCKMPFNNESGGITWENCSLRKWLNTSFLADNFTRQERDRIITVDKLLADEDRDYKYKRYDYTSDKVFLLSLSEAKKWFDSDQDRITTCNGNPCFWWLRTPIIYDDFAAVVDYDGSVNDGDRFIVHGKNGGVRPAIIIKRVIK